MKIEIDLNEVLRDDEGSQSESLEESVRRQVVDRLSIDLRKKIYSQIEREISDTISGLLTKAAEEIMPKIMDDIMNAEYIPISSYGNRGDKTTFRDELVKTIVGQMKYEPKSYESQENAFTRAVKSIVDLKTKAIHEEITKAVDTKFREDALAFAVKKLNERLGIKP